LLKEFFLGDNCLLGVVSLSSPVEFDLFLIYCLSVFVSRFLYQITTTRIRLDFFVSIGEKQKNIYIMQKGCILFAFIGMVVFIGVAIPCIKGCWCGAMAILFQYKDPIYLLEQGCAYSASLSIDYAINHSQKMDDDANINNTTFLYKMALLLCTKNMAREFCMVLEQLDLCGIGNEPPLLHHCAEHGCFDCCMCAVDGGICSIHTLDERGRIAFDVAGTVEIASYLLSKNVHLSK
jgi:hypothetical protein